MTLFTLSLTITSHPEVVHYLQSKQQATLVTLACTVNFHPVLQLQHATIVRLAYSYHPPTGNSLFTATSNTHHSCLQSPSTHRWFITHCNKQRSSLLPAQLPSTHRWFITCNYHNKQHSSLLPAKLPPTHRWFITFNHCKKQHSSILPAQLPSTRRWFITCNYYNKQHSSTLVYLIQGLQQKLQSSPTFAYTAMFHPQVVHYLQ